MLRLVITLPIKLYVLFCFLVTLIFSQDFQRDISNYLDVIYEGDRSLKTFLKLIVLNRDVVEVMRMRGARLFVSSKLFGVSLCRIFMSKESIGGGLVLHHPFLTRINCRGIGRDCQIWQMVTIGKSRPSEGLYYTPNIGNRVKISTGAVVVGHIEIGDDVVIGANCVITKDIPSGYTVIGNPAQVIKIGTKKIEPFLLP